MKPRTQNTPILRWIIASALLVAILLAALAAGDLALTPAEVWSGITGKGSEFTQTVVRNWRMPRALTAIAFGAALGAAGAIFQSLTRNPLGSPDVVGFNTGAFTGVLILLALVPAPTFAALATSSLAGGLVTAAIVLALTSGSLSGRNFLLTGIAVGAILGALNTWLLYKTDTATATTGSIWAAGTLDNVRWSQATPALIVLAITGIITAVLSSKLRILTLGDDLATALGMRVRLTKGALIGCAVLLTAITTAVAGPILFVALAAPHLARTLLPRQAPIAAAALVGALLLSAADWVAAHAFAPTQIPVGAVTVTLGGAYLTLSLLRREGRGAGR
ncbi:FecCD family ABC transporter permease [Leucobacter chinensis]|uniref:FecCD family ABC transporter permease n=1 Tax=Leucobacter chinensis TaxID=2851010 RepID=UPI001C20FAF9|nr:iron chelate uptake ABC transporter family permease subunit [Leucobacter chinensis]